MTSNPALGENRAVYSPGDKVRIKGDSAHAEGTVLMTAPQTQQAIVRWDDLQQRNEPEQTHLFDQLEKIVPAPVVYDTSTPGPSATVTGANPSPVGLSLAEAQSRRRLILGGRSPIQHPPLELAWSDAARDASAAVRHTLGKAKEALYNGRHEEAIDHLHNAKVGMGPGGMPVYASEHIHRAISEAAGGNKKKAIKHIQATEHILGQSEKETGEPVRHTPSSAHEVQAGALDTFGGMGTTAEPRLAMADPIPVYGGHPTLSGQPGGQPVAGPNDTQGQRPQQPPNLKEAVATGDTQYLTDQMCASCKWWRPGEEGHPPAFGLPAGGMTGGCEKYHVVTGGNQVCDSWQSRAGYDMAIVIEDSPLILALDEGGQPQTRFRKVSLRTGIVAAATPGDEGAMEPRPLQFIDGRSVRRSDGSFEKIGFDDIIESIDDPAFERITVPLSHADKVEENTGFVTGYRKLDDPDRPGEKLLELEHEITEPEVEGKLKRGSIYGSSVGLLFDYVRKSDLKRFPVALKHNALTNVPWVRGLGSHVMASEGSDSFVPITTVGGIPVAHVEVWHSAEKNKSSSANAADDKSQEGGDRMSDVQQAAAQLQLSEQSDLLRRQQEELNRLHADLHRRNVDDTVTGWASKGLDRVPGFLAKARQFMLADDGGPALVLLLSEEDGTARKEELSATKLIEEMVLALPFDETTGQLQAFAADTLATNLAKPPERTRVPAGMNGSDEFDNSGDAVKSRADEIAAELFPNGRIPGGEQ